jgi:hypothetical protein
MLEKIKKWKDLNSIKFKLQQGFEEIDKNFEWLITEIEQLQKVEIPAAYKDGYNDAAQQCTEIADNAKYNTRMSPSVYEDACLDIYDAICKEFGIDNE